MAGLADAGRFQVRTRSLPEYVGQVHVRTRSPVLAEFYFDELVGLYEVDGSNPLAVKTGSALAYIDTMGQ